MALSPQVDALLEYARHYGIALNPATRSPDSYLIDGDLDNIFPNTAPCDPHSLRKRYKELESELGHFRSREKLVMSREEGRFLARMRYRQKRGLEPDWNELLPPLRSQDNAQSSDELQFKTMEQELVALRQAQRDAAAERAKQNAFYDRKDFYNFTLLNEKTDGTDGQPGSTSSAAFVDNVLAISKASRVVHYHSTQILTSTDRQRQDASPQ